MGPSMVIVGLILSVIVLVVCPVKLKIHPFFALIATTVTFAAVSGMNMQDTAAFTLDVYGHYTANMRRDSANRMENFISSITTS